MVIKHACDGQWKCQVEKSKDFIDTKVWKGGTSKTLSDCVSKHRNAQVSMVQCSNHVISQLTSLTNRDRKLIRSVESTDPKSLVAIAKVETDDNVMSDFEVMAIHVLRYNPAANNEALAKSDERDVLEKSASSMVGSRTRQNLDLRFYGQKEFRTLSIQD